MNPDSIYSGNKFKEYIYNIKTHIGNPLILRDILYESSFTLTTKQHVQLCQFILDNTKDIIEDWNKLNKKLIRHLS